MGTRRDPDWLRTLDAVEQAVHGCLAALEKYETRFEYLLRDATPGAAHSSATLPTGAEADEVIAERLAEARGSVDPVEKLLAEQEAVWSQWQHTLSTWRQSLQHRAGAAT